MSRVAISREDAVAEAFAEGKAEGKAEGIEQERIKIALAMLKEGEPEARICRITGISRKELVGVAPVKSGCRVRVAFRREDAVAQAYAEGYCEVSVRGQVAIAMLKEDEPKAKICRITGISRKDLALLDHGLTYSEKLWMG